MRKLALFALLPLAACATATQPYSEDVQARIRDACSIYLVANVALIPFEQSVGADTMAYVNALRTTLDQACDQPPSNNLEAAQAIEEAVRGVLVVKNRVAGA